MLYIITVVGYFKSMRKIIHIDMDCFYAAVEMRDNPAYRDIPIAVGGNGPRSVLCTCNYQARQYGVRSAMPNGQAKQLCPELVIVELRMEAYQTVSTQIREIFQRYTDIIEPLSLDEAYLDVTNATACQGSATLIAQEIRQSIFDELNLTASAGIAPNKFLAKIASDENKPNGQCVVTPQGVEKFVEQLALKKIPGIGPKTAEKLALHGYTNCRDIRASSIIALQQIVGKFAQSLYQRGFGLDERALEVSRQRKSLAIETTLANDIKGQNACSQVANDLFIKLQGRLLKHTSRRIVKQGIKLKFSDFSQTTVEQQSEYCDQGVFLDLLEKALLRSQNRSIRLVGLTLGFSSQAQQEEVQQHEQLCLGIG
jgi:DNA polymerase-4